MSYGLAPRTTAGTGHADSISPPEGRVRSLSIPCVHLEGRIFSDSLLLPREGILKTAKALVEDTKVLVQNATASQEKLAQAAQSSVSTITRLAEVVKLGAASLGSEDPETQVRWGL